MTVAITIALANRTRTAFNWPLRYSVCLCCLQFSTRAALWHRFDTVHHISHTHRSWAFGRRTYYCYVTQHRSAYCDFKRDGSGHISKASTNCMRTYHTCNKCNAPYTQPHTHTHMCIQIRAIFSGSLQQSSLSCTSQRIHICLYVCMDVCVCVCTGEHYGSTHVLSFIVYIYY